MKTFELRSGLYNLNNYDYSQQVLRIHVQEENIVIQKAEILFETELGKFGLIFKYFHPLIALCTASLWSCVLTAFLLLFMLFWQKQDSDNSDYSNDSDKDDFSSSPEGRQNAKRANTLRQAHRRGSNTNNGTRKKRSTK